MNFAHIFFEDKSKSKIPSKTKPHLSLKKIKKIPRQIAKSSIGNSETSQPFGTVVVWERKKIGKHGILLFLLQVCVLRETRIHIRAGERDKVI